MNYKDITIEEAETIYRQTGCIFKCDADKLKVTIEGNLIESINKIFERLAETIEQVAKYIIVAFKNICEYIRNLFTKKISKKRFMKLLQSRGIQRNQINAIVYGNREKYTLFRCITRIPPTIANKKI